MNDLRQAAHAFAVDMASKGRISYGEAKELFTCLVGSSYGKRLYGLFASFGTGQLLPSVDALLPSGREMDEIDQTALGFIKTHGVVVVGISSLLAAITAVFLEEFLLAAILVMFAYIELRQGKQYLEETIDRVMNRIRVF